MPTFREITALRKSGDLDAAYAAAREALADAPHDRYVQSAYGWVLYEQLKRDVTAFEEERIAVGRLLHTVNRVAEEYLRLDDLAKPDLLHSLLLVQIVKVAEEWPGFIGFVRWWGMENFREEDREQYYPPSGGRPAPGLEMRVLHAIGKVLTRNRVDEDDIDWALSTIDHALRAHPDDTWLNYYKAKSLTAGGRGHEALRYLLPVVMRNLTASWVWDLMGQIIEPDDGDKAIICYYRAINLAGQPSAVLNTRVRLARQLAKAERFAEAARQVKRSLHDREKEGWAVRQDLAQLLDSAWFTRFEAEADTPDLAVEREALTILCGMFPEGFTRKTGVLESHNAAKELAYVAFSAKDGVTVPYRCNKQVRKMQPGTILDLSMISSDERPRVVSLMVSATVEIPGVVARVSGMVAMAQGRPFGFVNDSFIGRVFVSPDFVSRLRLADGASIEGTAVRMIDRKTGREGWKLLAVAD